jgi:hypothetical protein
MQRRIMEQRTADGFDVRRRHSRSNVVVAKATKTNTTDHETRLRV